MLLLITLVNNIVFNCLVEHFLCIGFDHCHIYWLLQSELFYSLYAEVALIAIYSMPGEMCVIFNHHIIFSFVNRNLISKVTYFLDDLNGLNNKEFHKMQCTDFCQFYFQAQIRFYKYNYMIQLFCNVLKLFFSNYFMDQKAQGKNLQVRRSRGLLTSIQSSRTQRFH